MNDIDAMKLYLEALAASKQKQQGLLGSSLQPQQQQQPSPSSPALLYSLRQAPPPQHHPLHPPKPNEEEEEDPSSSSSSSVADKPIPTKLHNLVLLGDEEDPEDDEEEEGHHQGRKSLGKKKKKTKKRKSRTASLSGATHGYSTNNAYATASSEANIMNSHPQDGTTSKALTTMTETLVMVSMEGPIPTRLIHLSLRSDEYQDNDTTVNHNKALLLPPADKASRLAREERWKRMREQLHRSGVLTARGTTPGQLPADLQARPLRCGRAGGE